jgi:hypothetical protein
MTKIEEHWARKAPLPHARKCKRLGIGWTWSRDGFLSSDIQIKANVHSQCGMDVFNFLFIVDQAQLSQIYVVSQDTRPASFASSLA